MIRPDYVDALDVDYLARAATAAEEAAFDSASVTDHLSVPAEVAPIYGSIAETLVSLGFLAGKPQRIRLGVSAPSAPSKPVRDARWLVLRGLACRPSTKERP